MNVPAALPRGVEPYKRTREFDETSVPAALLSEHSTKAGVWARVVVEEGELLLEFLRQGSVVHSQILSPSLTAIVEPQAEHRVTPRGRVRFYVEFCRSTSSALG